jgi:hypothetical protein
MEMPAVEHEIALLLHRAGAHDPVEEAGGVLDVDTDTNKYLYDADYKVHKHLYIHVWTTTSI